MLMDMEGWEQDGNGLRFLKPSTDEERKFKDWEDLYKFVLKLYGKIANESNFKDNMHKENQEDLSDLI